MATTRKASSKPTSRTPSKKPAGAAPKASKAAPKRPKVATKVATKAATKAATKVATKAAKLAPAKVVAAKKSAAKAPAKGKKAASQGPKLVAVSAPLLSRLDRPGYGGGARSVIFVGEDRLALGFQNSISLMKLGGASQQDLWVAGEALGFEPRTGRLLAAAFGEMSIFDLESQKLLARFKTSVGHGARMALSPDGTLCAVGDTSGEVCLFDLAGKKGIPALKGDERTRRYELPQGQPLATFAGSGIVQGLAFSPDGSLLAVGTEDGSVGVWDTTTHQRKRLLRMESGVRGVGFSPDGRELFVLREPGQVEVLSVSGKALRSFATRPGGLSLSVRSDGHLVVVAKQRVGLYDGQRGRLLAQAEMRAGWPPRVSDVQGRQITTVRPAMVFEVK